MFKQSNRFNLLLSLLLTGSVSLVFANDITDLQGDPNCRRSNTHSGNKVRTIFYNYGLVADLGEPSFEWPIGTGNEYVGDISILVGVEYYDEVTDTTVISVVHSDNPGHHPLDSDPENPSIFWGFEPLCGFARSDTNLVGMSHQPWTWPAVWPDKGWPGSWNGYFGRDVMNADQESYFIMDDARDQEFLDWIRPFPDEPERGGLGIQVKCRGFQWSHVLAEDAIIWLYEISNIGQVDYDKVAFGMICGTLVGGRQDSNDDFSLFDIDNDFTYSWDSDDPPNASPGWVGDVGYVGYAFLESPGNPYDGIDNDNDSQDGGSPRLDFSTITQMLTPRVLQENEEVIIIDYNSPGFDRSLAVLVDTLEVAYRDTVFRYYPGMPVWEDTLDLVDNNLNGLIDERFGFYDPETGEGVHYIDYFAYLNGGYVDPLIDERRDDGIDNDGDWDSQTDDVGADGMAGTGDYGEGDGFPTAGEPHFDQTDVTESDQIGLTSFDYFLTNELALRHDMLLWNMLEPGHFDVIDTGPGGEDGDFVYGSGFFPLRSGESRFFSLAVLFGEDYDDLLNNKITVQQIYDENYNFSRPPEKPQVSVVGGDGYVTLYWDNRAESSYDVINGFDFEGYKIYRATDAGFNEVYTITDGFGNAQFSDPMATFDLLDGIYGFFPLALNGVQFHLGYETGLQHVWTDTTAVNGQRYFYAVTAYDHGNADSNIFPAETSKFALLDESGAITTDVNTVWVIPSEPAAGYQPPTIYPEATHVAGLGTGSIELELVDPTTIRDGVTYQVLLDDTLLAQPDTSSNDTLWEDAGLVSVRNQLQEVTEEFLTFVYPFPEPPGDTLYQHNLVHDGIWSDGFILAQTQGTHLTPGEDYNIDFSNGVIYFLRGSPLEDGATLVASYNYDFPFRHLYDRLNNLTPVVDGIRLVVHNDWFVQLITEESGWEDTTRNLPGWVFELTNIHVGFFFLTGEKHAADYQVVFADDSISRSIQYDWASFHFAPHPLNFQVTNISDDLPVDIIFQPGVNRLPGPQLQPGDVVILAEADTVTWDFWLRDNDSTAVLPAAGDELYFRLKKPFEEDDVFEYANDAAYVDLSQAASQLDRVHVVPNPYLTAATWENRPLVPGSHGERKIQFIHLPQDCTIRIYTVRGELVKRLEHHGGVADGSLDWNLKSRDGLDIAYGIYVYHLESSVGEKIGKFAIIK